MSVCVSVYAHMYVCVSAHMHACLCKCVSVHVCVPEGCVCRHEYVCAHVCVVEITWWLVLIFSSTDIQIHGVLDPFNE